MAPGLAYIRAQLATLGPVNMSDIPLVVFTPSGKRGHFPIGTPVLTAARHLALIWILSAADAVSVQNVR